MQKSKIEWTDYTWNPITGCLKNCSYCYAKRMAENPFYAKAFPYQFVPHFYPERIKELCKIPAGSKVFVCSMGELFGENHEWTEEVLLAIENHPELTFQVLTKQPQNLEQFSPFPDNCWVGVSATDERMYVNAMVHLIGVEAKIKFVSFEPLLSHIDNMLLKNTLPAIDWLIIGQQTPVKKTTQPKVEWVKEIVDVYDNAKIPVFLKNNLTDLLVENNADWAFDCTRKLRQEMPVVSP
jgi:protein gp37